ncbi:polyketide cyclase, partial [uncultured Jatrophihabitans sp.]|uniref:polyketide cyclase n=1 Tax=uncultured Jatrophihabitans sp. TaxID=1610747 RepID=UPI0035CC2CE8
GGARGAPPPSGVWPGVVQIRLAPYSYDVVDNLGRRSPRRLMGLRDPLPGDPFTSAVGRAVGEVLSVTHEQQLTGRIAGAVMSYVLEPHHRGSRLLMKIVSSRYRASAPLLSVGDLVMARRQLLNLKALAEDAWSG